jgi:thiol-disulfide isomerase/thioredoxin
MGTVAIFGHAIAIDFILFLASTLVWAGIAVRMAGARAEGLRVALSAILLLGLIAARSVYVLAHSDSYRSLPWSVLSIADGGFIVFAGFATAALLTIGFGWRRRLLLQPLVAALTGGFFVWTLGLQLFWLTRSDELRLPAISLRRLDGHPIAMQDFSGQPLVVNLWASWCAPCRREMPTLRDAQLAEKGVVFVFANQGEDAATVSAYLDRQTLRLRNVLMDPAGILGVHAGSMSLPTTLFFSERGVLVKAHAGELSAAALQRYLQLLRRPG